MSLRQLEILPKAPPQTLSRMSQADAVASSRRRVTKAKKQVFSQRQLRDRQRAGLTLTEEASLSSASLGTGRGAQRRAFRRGPLPGQVPRLRP